MSTPAITRTVYELSAYLNELLVVAGGPTAALLLALAGMARRLTAARR
jgi:hypothetical protein